MRFLYFLIQDRLYPLEMFRQDIKLNVGTIEVGMKQYMQSKRHFISAAAVARRKLITISIPLPFFTRRICSPERKTNKRDWLAKKANHFSTNQSRY